MSRFAVRRGFGWASCVVGVCAALMAAASPVAQATTPDRAHTARPSALAVRTILNGTPHGWSGVDDVTSVGDSLFVAFQNGVPSTGGTTGTPTQSTIVKVTLSGQIEGTWQLTGKCDGLTADPATGQVIATVNEDGNSSLYTVPAHGSGPAAHYLYDANPLPHGGGTDSITIDHGSIYVVASAPASGGPALYRITLHDGIAHLAGAPFYDSSAAVTANTTAAPATVDLALTDPDSSTVVPRSSPRFGGDFMLDSQGDQQAIFAAHLGSDRQSLQVLSLSQSIDDTAFATHSGGLLVATDSSANSVVVISGGLTRGTAYTAVTPGNANTAPPNPAPNYLGTINLNTGVISPVSTVSSLTPHSLIYLPAP